MNIDVRLATARDRAAIRLFYNREGIDFQETSLAGPSKVKETMYIIANSEDMVVAALKLDIVRDKTMGVIGIINNFEIEDDLEDTDLGSKMLHKSIELAQEKGLTALNAKISMNRADLIDLYRNSDFKEVDKELLLQKTFRPSFFKRKR